MERKFSNDGMDLQMLSKIRKGITFETQLSQEEK